MSLLESAKDDILSKFQTRSDSLLSISKKQTMSGDTLEVKGNTQNELTSTKKELSDSVAPIPSFNVLTKSKFGQKKHKTEIRKENFSIDLKKFVKQAKGSYKDKYTIQCSIGKGGFGDVFRCTVLLRFPGLTTHCV